MKRKYILVTFVILGILLLPFIAMAEERAVEETTEGLESLLFEQVPVIYSAGFFAKSIKDAPGNSIVITAQQIQNSPARNMIDVLTYFVPGMSELIHENVGPTVAVRGVGVDTNAKTLVMLDGQHLNHRQHFGYATEMSVPLLGDIAQIEVVNGPGAIVHGSGAISGFVNMIPKNGTDYPGAFVTLERGLKENLTKVESGYGKSYGPGRDLYLYFGLLEAEGAHSGRPWPQTSSTAEPDALESLTRFTLRANAFPDPSYKIACYWNHDNFNLNSFFREEHMGLNGVYYRWQGAGEAPAWTTASMGIRPKYTIDVSDTEQVDLIGSILFMQAGHEADSAGVDHAENARTMDSENHFEFKAVGKTTRIDKHSLAAGFLIGRRGFFASDAYIHGEPTDSSGEGQQSNWYEIGLFAEDVMALTDDLTFSLGWRFDEVKYSPIKTTASNYQPPDANNISWRAATAYNIDSTSNIKLSYQEGFRYLDLAYLRWHSYFSSVLNRLGYASITPHEPETMSSTELNYHKDLNDIKMKLDFSIYHNVYDKMLHWHSFSTSNHAGLGAAAVAAVIADQGWMGCHLNAPGKFRTAGLEATGTWNPAQNTIVKLSYGYSVPIDVPDDVYLSLNLFTEDRNSWTFYPKHHVKADIVTTMLNDKLTCSIVPLYESAVPILDAGASFGTGATSDIYSHPRFVVDGSAEYRVNPQWSTKLVIKNIFETNVPPRTFKLKPYMGALGKEARYWYLSAKYEF